MWCIGADKVVTWGHPKQGGDSFEVKDQLKNVQQIFSTYRAFAAIFGRWKRGDLGRTRLCFVTAAVLADRSVVTWGESNEGGDIS